MATLLNFTNLEVHSRIIRLTCFDYDVIVIVVFELSKFQNIRETLPTGINKIRWKAVLLIRCFVVVT